MRVDLPLPVLPTIPVFMPPGKVTVRPFRTNGNCGAYFTCIKLKKNKKAFLLTLFFCSPLVHICPSDFFRFIDQSIIWIPERQIGTGLNKAHNLTIPLHRTNYSGHYSSTGKKNTTQRQKDEGFTWRLWS
jgi:hypothetical protein